MPRAACVAAEGLPRIWRVFPESIFLGMKIDKDLLSILRGL